VGLGVISSTGPWRSGLTIPQKQGFAKTPGWLRPAQLIERWNRLFAAGLLPPGAPVDAEIQWHCAVIDSGITSRYNGLASPAERNTNDDGTVLSRVG
jgi:hypothetical protein